MQKLEVMSLKNQIFNKSKIYPIVLILLMIIVSKCRENKQEDKTGSSIEIEGQTMGTFYSIKYLDSQNRNFKKEIDSLLVDFNQSLSTYIPSSEISTFNTTGKFSFELPYFYPVLKRSKEIHDITEGAFNPTIMPLVNAWGFGPDRPQKPDSAKVKELLKLVDFNNINFDKTKLERQNEKSTLDFSAIAKGYGVDVVAEYLKSKEITNLMVEIGGEMYCGGKNAKGENWLVGIEKPVEEERKLHTAIALENEAIATSGNYRNYHIIDGIKYAHTISPFTGFPKNQKLLSVSVITKDCMTADAFATAFMVLGLEKTISILNENPELKAYLIFSNDNNEFSTYTTDNLKGNIKDLN